MNNVCLVERINHAAVKVWLTVEDNFSSDVRIRRTFDTMRAAQVCAAVTSSRGQHCYAADLTPNH